MPKIDVVKAFLRSMDIGIAATDRILRRASANSLDQATLPDEKVPVVLHDDADQLSFAQFTAGFRDAMDGYTPCCDNVPAYSKGHAEGLFQKSSDKAQAQ